VNSPGERLVTVLVMLVVPDEADAEDAAGLVADAAVSPALEVDGCRRCGGASAGAGQPGGAPRRGAAVAGRWGVRGKRDPCRSGRQLGQDATHRPGSGPVAVTRADVPPGPGRVD